jgi:hypothetical protein
MPLVTLCHGPIDVCRIEGTHSHIVLVLLSVSTWGTPKDVAKKDADVQKIKDITASFW